MEPSLYERWKKREDPNKFDNFLLKTVRKTMYDGYKLIMLSVAEARPWDTEINLVAVFIMPWHLISGYNNPKYVEIHDDYYTDMRVKGERITVHYLTLHSYVTKLLEGEMNMYFAFRWWARAWFIDRNMRESLQLLHQHCMSQDTVSSTLFSASLELNLQYKAEAVDWPKVSLAVFSVGAIKYMLKEKQFPRNHFTATSLFNTNIVDDVVFARYKDVDFGTLKEYVSAQIAFLYTKAETTHLFKRPSFAHITGLVYQLRLTYADK